MATKHIQRNDTALFGVPLQNTVIYPFAISKKISKVVTDIYPSGFEGPRSKNILPDLCGYLTLQNKDILDGVVKCQVTSLVGEMYVELVIYQSLPGLPSQLIYDGIRFFRNKLDTEKPINFVLNKIACSNAEKNNLVRLFIYAYNSSRTTENSFDLGYFEEKTNI